MPRYAYVVFIPILFAYCHELMARKRTEECVARKRTVKIMQLVNV
jgi:hypothetical protein